MGIQNRVRSKRLAALAETAHDSAALVNGSTTQPARRGQRLYNAARQHAS